MSVTQHTQIPSLDRTIAGFLRTLAAQGGPPLYTVASAGSLRRLATLTRRRLVPVYADRRSILVRAGG